MREDRIREIQEKTMIKKSNLELKTIINNKSGKNWKLEAVEAAKRELENRKQKSTQSLEQDTRTE